MSEIENYIKKCFEKGYTREQIKTALIKNKWKESDVNRAFYEIELAEINHKLEEIPKPELVPMGTAQQEVKAEPKKNFNLDLKFKLPFKTKKTDVVLCPKCNTVMLSKDVEQFLVNEIKAIRSKQDGA